MNDKAYQQRELTAFLNQKHAFHDSVKDFSDYLENMNIPEQISWIENGSYGAGACYALQREVKGLTNRTNNNARIGQIVLHAFYGKPFRYWQKLSPAAQKAMNDAVYSWLQEKERGGIIEAKS